MLTDGRGLALADWVSFHCPQANLFMLTQVAQGGTDTICLFPLPSGKSLHA
jgi:hypothetical protein